MYQQWKKAQPSSGCPFTLCPVPWQRSVEGHGRGSLTLLQRHLWPWTSLAGPSIPNKNRNEWQESKGREQRSSWNSSFSGCHSPPQQDIQEVLGLGAFRAPGAAVVLPPSCIQLYMECLGLMPQNSAIRSPIHCVAHRLQLILSLCKGV